MKAVINTWFKGLGRGALLGAGFLSLAVLQPAAALTMDATRYVFTGDKDALSVTVTNEAGKTYGGQTWVESIVEKDSRPMFVVTPSFFKVSAGGKQVLRIIKAVELPQDKESIYWLNLQEIPPAMEGSGLAVAVRTRVKLFYRPVGLIKQRKDAEKALVAQTANNGLILQNTTPHVFVISKVLDKSGETVELEGGVLEKLNMFKPGDKVTLPLTARKIESINDLGYPELYPLGGQPQVAKAGDVAAGKEP